MEASFEQIEVLEKLQEVDRIRLRAKKQAMKLSQREEVLALRKRKNEIAEKLAQIVKLYELESRQLSRIEVEDCQLQEKQTKVQEKIDASSNDYRSVAIWTRDLEGMVKRRNTLEHESAAHMEKMDEIEKVKTQAENALAELDSKEQKLVEDYHTQSGELRDQIEKCEQAGRMLAAQLSDEILNAYGSAVKRCGGIGVAHLEDDHCSACRKPILANRLPEIKREAPLAKCPNCQRMLIIK